MCHAINVLLVRTVKLFFSLHCKDKSNRVNYNVIITVIYYFWFSQQLCDLNHMDSFVKKKKPVKQWKWLPSNTDNKNRTEVKATDVIANSVDRLSSSSSSISKVPLDIYHHSAIRWTTFLISFEPAPPPEFFTMPRFQVLLLFLALSASLMCSGEAARSRSSNQNSFRRVANGVYQTLSSIFGEDNMRGTYKVGWLSYWLVEWVDHGQAGWWWSCSYQKQQQQFWACIGHSRMPFWSISLAVCCSSYHYIAFSVIAAPWNK